jgi:hypothetical protein
MAPLAEHIRVLEKQPWARGSVGLATYPVESHQYVSLLYVDSSRIDADAVILHPHLPVQFLSVGFQPDHNSRIVYFTAGIVNDPQVARIKCLVKNHPFQILIVPGARAFLRRLPNFPGHPVIVTKTGRIIATEPASHLQ